MPNRILHSAVTKKKTAVAKELLIGDASVAYAVGDQTTVSRIEFFQFTAKKSGTVEQLEFRTGSIANPGVTSVILGIYSDSAGKPGTPLGEAAFTGEPGTEAWIAASGLSIAVVAGTSYWMAMLPKGTAGKQMHYAAATAENLGTGNVESNEAGYTKLEVVTTFQTFNEGPVGFQGLGTVGTTGGGQVVLPGAVLGQGFSERTKDWLKAAEAGCRVGRVEEGNMTLTAATKAAEENGMKLCYIFNGNSGTFEALVTRYEQLVASRQATVLCFEIYNESWPGGVGQQFNGKAYGEKFIAAAKVQREKNLNVPLLMQTRLDRSIGTKWMKELGEVNLAELTKALEPKPEGKAILPTGNWLASHPYYNKATLAQSEPNNLGTSGATSAYKDTSGNEWGFQRFMKEIQYVKNLTGLNVPCALTEYGVRWAGNFGEVNSVGSHEKVAEYVKALWEFMKTVEEETVPSPPTGLTPKVPFVCWYDEYSHRSSAGNLAQETYGFYYFEEESKPVEKNESNSMWKLFKEGAEKL